MEVKLEKTANGGTCRQSSRNPMSLRTFCDKYPMLLNEDGWRTVEDGYLRLQHGEMRI